MGRAYDARPTVGYDGGGMSRDDREHWEHAHAKASAPGPAAPFLVEHVHLLRPGRVVDVAAGTGRNAAFLAARGHRVIAVDVARAALARVHAVDARIACVQMDLDAPGLRAGSVDAVVVVNFLDRRLFSEVGRWLRPGCILIWDTFLIDQREIGHPRNPSFLLARGELVDRLAHDFRILVTREGAVDDGGGRAYRSGIVGERLGPKP
jgi:SAM-dependent methyltransferase